MLVQFEFACKTSLTDVLCASWALVLFSSLCVFENESDVTVHEEGIRKDNV